MNTPLSRRGWTERELYTALPKEFVANGDSTVNVSYGHQENAAVGYNPFKSGRCSHHPLICIAAGTRLCLHMSWRASDEVGAADWTEMMDIWWAHPTIRERLKINRGDTAFGQEAILAWHEREDVPRPKYVFGMRLTKNVRRALAQVLWPLWEGEPTNGLKLVAETTVKLQDWSRTRRVVFVTGNGAATLPRARALLAQRTGRANGAGQLVFPSALGRVQPPRFHGLAGRAADGVGGRVMLEVAVRKDAGAAGVILFRAQVAQMGANVALAAGDEVLGSAVFAVAHRGGDLLARQLFMLLDQWQQPMILRHVAGRGLHGGDHAVGIVQRTMMVVARAGRLVAFTHDGRVGIGRAEQLVVDVLVVTRGRRVGQLGFGRGVGGSQGGDQLRGTVAHRVTGGVGVIEAAVHVQLRAVHQTGGHALADRAHEELLEHRRAPAFPGLRQNTVIRNRIVETEVEEPEVIEPLGQDAQQFPFAGEVVVEQEEHQLEDDFGRDGFVAMVAVTMGHLGADEGEVHGGLDLAQRVIGTDPLIQIDAITEQVFLRLWLSHHARAFLAPTPRAERDRGRKKKSAFRQRTITAAQPDLGNTPWTLDIVSNRTNRTTLEGVHSYACNANNWLTDVMYPDGRVQAFSYL